MIYLLENLKTRRTAKVIADSEADARVEASSLFASPAWQDLDLVQVRPL